MTDLRAKTIMGNEPSGHRDRPFALEDLSGQDIAGCRVMRKLGQGAMGAVYLAEQKSLRRTVALKVLDPKFSRDATYIERFVREAQAAARLTHYNIVQVFDFGNDGDIYYILSEFVDGGTVQQLIDAEGVVDPAKANEIMLQAARGLGVAQDNAVIHRDIKPDNLMLTKDGVVKIADFGLAKLVADDSAVTQSGMIVGTPFYMSPEQAKGLPLDGRSDIYSLGVTYFHMVTGQIPFDADSVIGVLLKQISAERPDPVAINPALPPSVGPVILRMMDRTPEGRYQTARELVDTLERLKNELAGKGDTAFMTGGEDGDRAARYKMLRSNQIIFISQREVTPQMAKKMLSMLKGDTGVTVQTKDYYPEKSIVEVRFTVPGRDELFSAIGVVRWVSDDPQKPGVGVTFLKVNSARRKSQVTREPLERTVAPAPGPTASAATAAAAPPPAPGPRSVLAPRRTLPSPEAMRLLTKTPLHCRALRYYYANIGQLVEPQQVANALGVGKRMLGEVFDALEQSGLVISRDKEGLLSLVWPEDQALQQEIVNWITKFGLV